MTRHNPISDTGDGGTTADPWNDDSSIEVTQPAFSPDEIAEQGDIANDIRSQGSDTETAVEGDNDPNDGVHVADGDDSNTDWVVSDPDADGSVNDETGSDPDDVTGVVDEGDDGVTVGSASGEGATTVDGGATNPATGEPIDGGTAEPSNDPVAERDTTENTGSRNRRMAAGTVLGLLALVALGGS